MVQRLRRLLPLFLPLAVLAQACTEREQPPAQPPVLELAPVSFAALPGWSDDDPRPALAAFRLSCGRFERGDPARPVGGSGGFAGKVADWLPACAAAARTPDTQSAARAFFEAEFLPYRASDRGKAEGLFTGYYEPLLDGSREASARFRHPLLARPPDLVSVDLGQFDPELQGRRVAGRVEGGKLLPYPDRAAIEAGALAGKDLELFWVDDQVARFFLEIQGSGQLRLPDGETVRVGYADQNGQPYRAIGRDLVEFGALTKEQVSMQAIREWLAAHPDQAPAIMARNRSFVFFRELPAQAQAAGPLGAQNVPLTPGRSLAVDRKYLPLGAPVWLDATVPHPKGEVPLRRLLVAQDTGGAIRGPVRGDVFWGAGPEAEHLAGHMKHEGRLFVLLPRRLAPVG